MRTSTQMCTACGELVPVGTDEACPNCPDDDGEEDVDDVPTMHGPGYAIFSDVPDRPAPDEWLDQGTPISVIGEVEPGRVGVVRTATPLARVRAQVPEPGGKDLPWAALLALGMGIVALVGIGLLVA